MSKMTLAFMGEGLELEDSEDGVGWGRAIGIADVGKGRSMTMMVAMTRRLVKRCLEVLGGVSDIGGVRVSMMFGEKRLKVAEIRESKVTYGAVAKSKWPRKKKKT